MCIISKVEGFLRYSAIPRFLFTTICKALKLNLIQKVEIGNFNDAFLSALS